MNGTDTIGTQGGVVGSDVFSNAVLASGQSGINNNFGEVLPASIAGYVYNDANDNGVFDTNESGIAGVTITLTGTNDLGQSVSLTTTTSSAGAYSFAGLRPGTYAVAETQPAGYLNGTDTIGTQGGVVGSDVFSNAVLASGQSGINNNFGEVLPASIAGYVCNDANDNGVFDTNESGIANVTVTLTGTNDLGQSVSLTTTTSSTGAYSFGNLRPGTYTLTETQPASYLEGHDNVGSLGGSAAVIDVFSGVAPTAGASGTGYDFGEILPASVAGYVYNDANDNGVFDANESGIAGVTITLTGTNDLGQAIDLTTTTSSTGAYSFGNLRPGTYMLTETQPAGYLEGHDNVGSLGGSAAVIDVFSGVAPTAGAAGPVTTSARFFRRPWRATCTTTRTTTACSTRTKAASQA